ncbi:MAG: hypothetical protein WB676_16490 [Bryobacteraceae bacterium]
MAKLFDEPSRKPLPATPELEDHRTAVIRGAISAIPVFGGALAEELGLVLEPPLTRRRDEWFEDLARRLRDLENNVEGFRFAALANNDHFVSATVQATQVALRTHQQEKLDALRNAVLNTAVGNAPNDSLQTIFLNLVDRLTPLHLTLLKNIESPRILPDSGAYQQWDYQNRHSRRIGMGVVTPAVRNPPHQAVRFFKDQIEAFKSESDEFVEYLLRDLYVSGLMWTIFLSGRVS